MIFLAILAALALCWRASGPGHVEPLSALLAAAFAFCLSRAARGPADNGRRAGIWKPALLGAGLFAALTPLLRAWVWERFGGELSYSLHLFYLGRHWPDYEGIPSRPFAEWARLAWPLLWWSGTLALAWRAWRRPSPSGLWVLAACAFAGKFAVASLSSSGLDVLPQQVQALSTAYYRLAQAAERFGIFEFIRGFNAIQPKLGVHGETHPFGPELFYWSVARLHPGPWLPSLLIAAATSLNAWFLGRLAELLGLGPRGGLAAALLYLASPASAILAASGIDCVATLLGTSACYGALRGRLFLAGWLLFCMSLLSGLAAAPLLLLALLARPQDWRRGAWKLLAPLAGGHLALWLATGGAFRYGEALRYALSLMAQGPGARPYWLWAWLDPLLYAGYLGLGSLGLLLSLGPALLSGRLRAPAGLLAALAVLGGLWMQGIGHAEVQRIHHWGYGPLSLAAALALARDRDWESRGFFLAALFASLNALGSVALEILVIDYW